MKFLPESVTALFTGKRTTSEALARASERAKRRTEEMSGAFGGQTVTEASVPPLKTEKLPTGPGFDAKTLIMAVSLVANGLLAGTLYGKWSASEQVESLRGQVSQLREENQKMKRESAGKIRVTSDEVVVPVGQIRATLEYVDVLKARVAELESGSPKVSDAARRAAPTSAPAASSASNIAPTAVPKSAKYAETSKVVASVMADMPPEISVKVAQNAGFTVVTYSDPSGFTRYFTADRSENASKLTHKGLQAWVNEKYMASLDEQARKQGALK